jgi:hypothetical protein
MTSIEHANNKSIPPKIARENFCHEKKEATLCIIIAHFIRSKNRKW